MRPLIAFPLGGLRDRDYAKKDTATAKVGAPSEERKDAAAVPAKASSPSEEEKKDAAPDLAKTSPLRRGRTRLPTLPQRRAVP